jgi:lipopolysaccharide export system protein LptA
VSRTAKLLLRRFSALLLVLAIAGVAALAVIRARALKGLVGGVSPPSAGEDAGGGGEAVSVYSGFEYTESVAGKILFALNSARTLGLASGWHQIEGVRLQFYNRGIGGAVLTCDSASFNKETRDAKLSGAIHFEFPDGGFVTSERGVFDASSRVFSTETDVVFSGGGAIGRAGKAVYHLTDDVLTLEDVVVRLTAGGSLRAPEVVYWRGDHRVELPKGCRLDRAGSRLDAPRATVSLEGVQGPPARFQFSGGVTLSGSAGGGQGSLGGWAREVVAVRDGETRWQITATTDGPWVELLLQGGDQILERRLQCWVLRASMAEQGLQNVRAEDGVCLTDVPMTGAPRNGSAVTARLRMGEAGAGDVDLDGNVVLASDDLRATGHHARLIAATGLAMLNGDQARGIRATLVSGQSRIVADQVHLFEQEQRAEARGNVQGQVERMELLAGQPNTGEIPLHFAAEVLEVEEGGENLHLKENARAWQGDRLLFADEIQYLRSRETLEASGHVRTTFPSIAVSGIPAPGGGGEVLIVAKMLTYDRGARRAIYTGDVRYSDGEYVLTAGEVDILFGENDTVSVVEATGAVDIVEPASGRRMKGDHARWQWSTQTIDLTGNPAQLTDEKGNVTNAASLTWDRTSGRVTVSGGTETIYHPEEKP